MKEFHSHVSHTLSCKMLRGKSNIVHLERNNPRHQYMLVAAYLENFAEQDLWILRNTMVNMTQQHDPAVMKGASILGCIKGTSAAGEGR